MEDWRGGAAAHAIEDHAGIEPRLLDERRECTRKSASGKRGDRIESARPAAVVTLHEHRVPKRG